jgi:serine protease Do
VLFFATDAAAAAAPPSASLCSGAYADFLTSMNARTRAFEASDAAGGYTYCIRTVATYEHVFYGRDGKLQRRYVRHVRHGTAFAYQAQGGAWYLATNEHVTEHPPVTEQEGQVEGVPAGSRKVREMVRIVAGEADTDEAAQIPLEKVAADEALDLAVLKSTHPLKVMPYRIGSSAALRVGNAVQVRGYPLGAFAASNTGRVISTGQWDRDRSWDHEDFAIDALLNSGNSGSPVFAVSCKTGELELVGVYHAGYKDAQGLNVVVGVDQLKDFLATRKRPARPAPTPVDRTALLARMKAEPAPLTMPFGERAVRVDIEGTTVRFGLLDPEFPLTATVEMVLVDRDGNLTRPAAVMLPERFGATELSWSRLDPTLQDSTLRFHEALWSQAAAVLAYRHKRDARASDPEAPPASAPVAALIRGRRGEQREILQAIDLDDDLLRPRLASPSSEPPRESSLLGAAAQGR